MKQKEIEEYIRKHIARERILKNCAIVGLLVFLWTILPLLIVGTKLFKDGLNLAFGWTLGFAVALWFAFKCEDWLE